MFEKPGKALKKVAVAIFWIEVIVCLLLGCALGIDGDDVHIKPLIGIPVGGFIVAYLSNLLFIALADHFEQTEKIASYLYSVKDCIQEIQKKTSEANTSDEEDSAKKETLADLNL